MLRKLLPFRIVAIPALMALVFTLGACGESRPRQRENLTVGVGAGTYAGLLFLAEELGSFERNGLHVTIRDNFEPGILSVDALLRGEIDVGYAADFACATRLLQDKSLRILSSIAIARNIRIVARRDRGVEAPADLRGKRIGVTKGAIGEYILYTFLLAHHITMEEVVLVDVPLPNTPVALASGQVDAVVTWQRHLLACVDRLGSNAMVWDAQPSRYTHILLVTTEGVISRHADALRRLLAGLAETSTFVRSREDRAKAMLRSRMRYDVPFFESVWKGTRLELALDQSLIESMEDAARWRLKPAGQEAVVPNYLHYIYFDGLEAVNPRLITIHRQSGSP